MTSGTWAQTGPLAMVTLERPPINGLDRQALDELGAAFDQVATEPTVQVVVIASGLERTFCSGGDLEYWFRIADGLNSERWDGLCSHVSSV